MCDTGNEKESHALWYLHIDQWKLLESGQMNRRNFCADPTLMYTNLTYVIVLDVISNAVKPWIKGVFIILPMWLRNDWPKIFMIMLSLPFDIQALLFGSLGWLYLRHHWEVHQPVAPKYQEQSSCIWWPTWMKHTWSRHAVTSKGVVINPSAVSLKNLFVFISLTCVSVFFLKYFYIEFLTCTTCVCVYVRARAHTHSRVCMWAHGLSISIPTTRPKFESYRLTPRA